jgi:hypothetical protein
MRKRGLKKMKTANRRMLNRQGAMMVRVKAGQFVMRKMELSLNIILRRKKVGEVENESACF